MCRLKLVVVLVTVILSAGMIGSVRGDKAQTTQAGDLKKHTVMENLPRQVGSLFKWPALDAIAPKQFMTGKENVHVLRAKRTSLRWIGKVIDAAWLPENPDELKNKLIMVKDEFGPIDVTHLEWKKNNWIIRVSQSQTVFTITLLPNHNVVPF